MTPYPTYVEVARAIGWTQISNDGDPDATWWLGYPPPGLGEPGFVPRYDEDAYQPLLSYYGIALTKDGAEARGMRSEGQPGPAVCDLILKLHAAGKLEPINLAHGICPQCAETKLLKAWPVEGRPPRVCCFCKQPGALLAVRSTYLSCQHLVGQRQIDADYVPA